MSRTYKCAPLPFMGQKRYFIRDFTEVLERVDGQIDTVVDLFGGSGLLSHTAKHVLPGCRVVYNDFDRYIDRLAAVDQTNEILKAIKERLTGVEPNQRLTPGQRAEVLAVVREYEQRDGYVDILTIGRNVLFSGKWVTSLEELCKHTMYNRVRPGAYECGGYLDVLRLLKGTKYVCFTSDKSQIVELCQWLAGEYRESAPMYGAEVRQRTNTLNYQAKFNDMMITRL